MGAVPKRRTSTHRKGKRRASIAQRKVHLVKCGNCGEKKRMHQTCPSCGKYS